MAYHTKITKQNRLQKLATKQISHTNEPHLPTSMSHLVNLLYQDGNYGCNHLKKIILTIITDYSLQIPNDKDNTWCVGVGLIGS